MSNIKILMDDGVANCGVEFVKFSDGAEICQITPTDTSLVDKTTLRVVLDVQNCTRDIVRLALVKEAIKGTGYKGEVGLTMLYIPNARADRRFTKDSAFALKVFCKILNDLEFSSVLVADPHSDVSTALIENVSVIDQTQCFKTLLPQIKHYSKNFILCAPDLGATKKIFDTVVAIGHEDYLQAVKIRDVKTGNIVKCDIQCDDLEGKDVVIIDDLCDGGASFKFLAEKLLTKNCGKIILYTTHGIYSNGLDALKGYIDQIYCYNLLETYINKTDIYDFNQGER